MADDDKLAVSCRQHSGWYLRWASGYGDDLIIHCGEGLLLKDRALAAVLVLNLDGEAIGINDLDMGGFHNRL
ncbi:MAG: hypothetical protein IRY85_06960 [Micromonosporaceae bacterium]|nr:hypothetical protein [Micromonosporaceae bacterium]